MDPCTLPRIRFTSTYQFDCYRDGELVWTDTNDNLVVNEGLELALDCIFGDIEKQTFHLGIIDNNAAIIPEDTMGSHNFVEFNGTTNVYRPVANFTKGELTGNTWSYVAHNVQCMIAQASTVYGGFVTTGRVKGEHDGVLYGAALMASPRAVIPGDALLITITVKATG